MRRPCVIAHRGASGYEYENSRAAFRRAIMLDADGVELDIQLDSRRRDRGAPRPGDSRVWAPSPSSRSPRPASSASPTARRCQCSRDPGAGGRPGRMGGGEEPGASSTTTCCWPFWRRVPAPQRYAVHSFDHRIVHRLGDRDAVTPPRDPALRLSARDRWQSCAR